MDKYMGACCSNKRGFTIVEMLLSIALVTIIAGIGVPIYQSLQVRNDLDVAVDSFVQSARRAQVLARASDGDTNWGVYATSSTIAIFKGASYAGRDSDYDEVFLVPTSITPSGVQEIVFEKFIGLPQTTGTTTLTSNTNEVRTIHTNDQGTFTY